MNKWKIFKQWDNGMDYSYVFSRYDKDKTKALYEKYSYLYPDDYIDRNWYSCIDEGFVFFIFCFSKELVHIYVYDLCFEDYYGKKDIDSLIDKAVDNFYKERV